MRNNRLLKKRISEVILLIAVLLLGLFSLSYTGFVIFENASNASISTLEEGLVGDVLINETVLNTSDTTLENISYFTENNVSSNISLNETVILPENISKRDFRENIIEEYLEHGQAVVNEPVRWDHVIAFSEETNNIEIEIPKSAYDVSIVDENGREIINFTRLGETNIVTGGIVKDTSKKGFFGFLRDIFRFTGFTVFGEPNNKPIFFQIPNQTWEQGDSYTIDLYPYVSDLDNDDLIFGATPLENIVFNIEESLITFNADNNFSGQETIWFSVSDGENISYSEGVVLNVLPLEKELYEETAYNQSNTTSSYENKEFLVQDEIPLVIGRNEENITIVIHESVNSLYLQYKTPGPFSREEIINPYQKRVYVFSDFSYPSVLVYTNVSLEKGGARVYSVKGSKKELYSSNIIDLNEDGILDRISWSVPYLKEEIFEVEIIILTVQSYPQVGSNWTVAFQTIGSADLTINAVSGTEFSYGNSSGDLEFLELRCGNNFVNTSFNGSISYNDYSCKEDAYESSKVLTVGKHTLEFIFGDQVAYAYNTAWGTDDCSIPGPDRRNLATIRRCGVTRHNGYYNVNTQIFLDNRSTEGRTEVSIDVYSLDPSIRDGDINITFLTFSLADSGQSDCCNAIVNGSDYNCLDMSGSGSQDCGISSGSGYCDDGPQLVNQTFCVNAYTTSTNYDWVNFTVRINDTYDPDCLNFTLTTCNDHSETGGFVGCVDGNNNSLTLGNNYSLTYGDACTIFGGLGVSLESPVNGTIDTDGDVTFNCTAWDYNTSILNLSFYWNYPGTFRLDYIIDPAETVATPSNKMQVLLHLNNDSYERENSTFAVDFLEGRNNGTFKGEGEPIVSSGQLIKGLKFDGVDDFVNLSYIDALAQENVTISAWATEDYIVSLQYDPVVAQYQSVTNNGYWLGYLNGRVVFELSGTQAIAKIGDSVVARKWFHLVGTHNTTSLSIYRNGTFLTSAQKTGTGVVTSAYLGYDQDGKTGTGSYHNGSIDEVVIFNRTLSKSEVQDLYNSYVSNQTFMSRLFTRTNLSNGTYLWNCQAWNNLSENAFALHNYTFYITNTAYPNVTLSHPADRSSTTGASVTFGCNITDDYEVSNITFYWNASTGNFIANETIWPLESIDETNISFRTKFNGNSNTTDAQNATTDTGTHYETGRISRAIFFNAGDDLRYGLGDNFNKSRGTLSMWVKFNQSISTGENVRYLYRHSKNKSEDFSIRTNPGDDTLVVNYIGRDSIVNLSFGNSNNFTANTWNHLAVSWNTSNDGLLKIYRNGVLVNTQASFSEMENYNNTIFIGGFEGNQVMNGSIDEVIFYNDRVLTDAEVLDLYRSKVSVNQTFALTNLADGTYLWNCQAYDNNSQGAFGVANWSVTVGDDAPVVNLSQPVNNKIFANLVNLYLECNITDDNEITNVSLYHNISENFILNQTIDPRETMIDANKMQVLHHFNNNSLLGENSSFAVDSLGNNNGTFKAPGQPKIDAGKFNKGVTFIGSSATGQINLSTVEALGNTNVTIMAWIKSGDWNAADGTDHFYPILTQSNISYFGYYLYIGGSAEARRPGFTLDDTSGALPPSTMNFSVNRWYHVAGTHNDTHVSIYVDGVIRASKVVTGSGVKKAAYIGFDDISDYFNGSIDEVVIYNRTLNAAEIAAHYAYTKTSYSANFTFPNFDQTGSYKWNCLAVDDANQNSWAATNRSFVVDSCIPPKDATWLVNKVCTKKNEILSVAQDYNLNISRDGKLHFSNVTLIINQTGDGLSFVYVSGFFNITRASNITSVNPNFEFDFQALPGSSLNASDSYFSELGYGAENIGLTISSPGSFLINNSFTEIRGITILEGNSTFVDNRFFGDPTAGTALLIVGDLSNISNNLIENVTGAGGGGDSDAGIGLFGNQNFILYNTIRNIGGKQTGGAGEIGYGIDIGGNDNKIAYNNISNNDAVSTSSAAIFLAIGSTNNNITNNTISYNTNEYNGIILASSTPGNRIINNTIQFNNRYQIISSGNTVIEQNIIQMNGRQIAAGQNARAIDTGGRDNITENVILVTGGSYADTIYVDTNLNNITNNSITTQCSSCYGITLAGGDFNIFNRNTINTTDSSSNGIDASASSAATLNNFSKTTINVESVTGSIGINLNGLSNSNFTFNDTTVVASGTGIYVGSPGNKFFNTIVNGTSGPGVLLTGDAYNNTFMRLRINETAARGFRMSGAGVRDNLIKDFIIFGRDEGIEFDTNPSQNLFLDGEVGSGTEVDDYNLYITGSGGGRVNTLLNVTLVQNTTTFSTSDDFIIDRQWYLDVFANYSNATNAVNANVTALQVNQSFSFSALTANDGFIVQQNLTEYRENATTKTYFTNYTINVSQNGFVNMQRFVNMTYNRVEYFSFANVAPTIPTLTAPTINNYTTNRTPEFIWQASTDIENDPIVYDLILECLPIGGGTCSSDNRVFANLTNTSYHLLYDIRLLQDNGWFYNWTVRAWDNKSYSNNATKRNLTVASYIAISLPTDNINFTSVVPGQSVTSYNAAQMTTSKTLNVSNDGNAITNVSIIESEALWDSLNKRPEHFSLNISHGDSNYGSKGACSVGYRNWGYGTAAWFPIPSSSNAGHICQLSYLNQSDGYNSALVYINITAPSDEPGGQKNARLTFTAYLAE